MQGPNFREGWVSLWNTVSGAFGGLATLLTWIGIILLTVSVITWIMRKARGGGGNTTGLVWTTVIGAILCAPQFLMPLIFGLIDLIIGVIIALWQAIPGVN